MPTLILDGGISRELIAKNAPFAQPEWSALSLYQTPHLVQEVHADFIASGADIVTTNSYAIVPFHIGDERFKQDGERLADLAGRLARQAVENSNKSALVAGSLPPLFGSYRADLIEPTRFTELATPLIKGLSPHVDIWLFETQSAIIEPISVKPLLPKDNRPVWVSFTLIDDFDDINQIESHNQPKLRSGESVQLAVEKMIALDVQAILFNCSQPEVMSRAIVIAKQTLNQHHANHIKIGVYANAFAPQPKNATANDGLDEVRDDLNPDAYLLWAKEWVNLGVDIVGGCCGISAKHIETLAKNLK